MKSQKYLLSIIIAGAIVFSSCKKYLEAKSNQSLTTINNLTDVQSLLDNFNLINLSTVSGDLVSCDDYYLSNNDFQTLDMEQMRNMYTWQPANLFYPYTALANDWNSVYNNVYVANTVLDNISNIQRSAANASEWDNVKGQAHFLRAYNFYKAVTIWSLAYDQSSASTDLGISLRLSSNFNERSIRSSVAGSYDQILQDLKLAVPLLAKTPIHVYRSGKPAAYALLARTYLAMRQYQQAGAYADSCLQISSKLIDYNKLSGTATYPLPKFNDEIIYDTTVGGSGSAPINRTRARIDTFLIASYAANDLRSTLFFSTNVDGSKLFRGNYEGSATRFNGIATDEIYLIRAECYARNGNLTEALADLNKLLQNRYKTGTFTAVSATTTQDALTKILAERRKELVMRGNRWIDIKRLNKEGAAITLKRNINGKTFTLPPNDLRFALPIPEDVIALSGMQQNPR